MRKIELYLSLGSNSGDREFYLNTALSRLDKAFGKSFRAVSDFIETEPWGFVSEYAFLNAAVAYELDFPDRFDEGKAAEALLDICKGVEASLGRVSVAEYDSIGNRVYSSRTIDIDIIFLGTLRVDTARISIPHKLAAARDFVKIPMRQIASEEILQTFPNVLND